MPRVTVYTPEDLWADAKKEAPDLSPSQLFQSALRDLVEAHRARPEYAQLSDDLAAARDETRSVVREQATEAYRVGYRLGLALAEELHWEAFSIFAEGGWNFDEWKKDVEDVDHLFHDPEWDKVTDLELALDELVAGRDLPQAALPPVGYIKDGLEDAARDVWEGLRAPRSARRSVDAEHPRGSRDHPADDLDNDLPESPSPVTPDEPRATNDAAGN